MSTSSSEPPLPKLSARLPESHKGDFGRVLLVGASRGMTGSISLAGMAALRSGAGLVTLAVPDICQDVVASFEPSYMTVGLPSDGEGRLAASAEGRIVDRAEQSTAMALGPGLGSSSELERLVSSLYRRVELPMIVDADGLNSLAAAEVPLADHAGARILTPHPGEFARIVGGALNDKERRRRAIEIAAAGNLVLVVKGHRTLTTDGTRQATNPTGSPALATGGTGDVLTGVITALLCQGLEPFEAAQLGVYVHGRAGDLAGEKWGELGAIARDLIDLLPEALREVQKS